MTAWLAAAVIAAFLAVTVRRYLPEQGLAVGLTAGALLLTAVFADSLPLFRDLKEMLGSAGLSADYVVVLFKSLGVCLLTQLAADACRDAGEQGLAAKAELAGKVMLLTLSLPLFHKMGEIVLALMGGTL